MGKNWTRADAQAEINRAAKRPVETFKKFCAELKSAVEEIVRIGAETGFKDDATKGLRHLQACMCEIEKTFTPHTGQPRKSDEHSADLVLSVVRPGVYRVEKNRFGPCHNKWSAHHTAVWRAAHPEGKILVTSGRIVE